MGPSVVSQIGLYAFCVWLIVAEKDWSRVRNLIGRPEIKTTGWEGKTIRFGSRRSPLVSLLEAWSRWKSSFLPATLSTKAGSQADIRDMGPAPESAGLDWVVVIAIPGETILKDINANMRPTWAFELSGQGRQRVQG